MKNYSKKEITDYYTSKPMTINEVADKFGLCNVTISRILNEFGIERYSKTKLFSPNLKEDYFSIIDNEYKAYFLGLIISDGCIFKNKSVSITLQDCDLYLLEEFIKQLNSNKVPTTDGRGCHSISIISKELVKDLQKYYLVPNKSLNTIFPNNIPKDMYRHMIRGLIDGDGSISFYSRKERPNSYTKAVRMCQGNYKFLEDMVNYLHDNVGLNKLNIYQEKETLWSFAYRKNEDMLKLYHYLYDDSHIFMRRKKDKYDLIINDIESRR